MRMFVDSPKTQNVKLPEGVCNTYILEILVILGYDVGIAGHILHL